MHPSGKEQKEGKDDKTRLHLRLPYFSVGDAQIPKHKGKLLTVTWILSQISEISYWKLIPNIILAIIPDIIPDIAVGYLLKKFGQHTVM